MDVKKDAVVVHTLSLPSSSSSTLGKHKGDLQQTAGTESSKQRKSSSPINTSTVAKGKEFLAFAGGCIRTYVKDMPTRHKALSNDGAFAHYVVEPWYEWFGRNSRITTSPALSSITLRPCRGQQEPPMINGGSFNYVGTYGMCAEYEELHRKCLDTLPVLGEAVPLIGKELERTVADFWGADCCFTTPTGYQSNILVFTAILDDSWFVLLDQKSHSSMTTAGYLANAGGRKKFAHNDMLELERLLDEVEDRYANIMVAVEGLYSLDGDMPDLAALSKLKTRYGFVLLCDEAHSFLSLGTTGRGCVEWWNDMHPTNRVPSDLIDVCTTTLSKAVGGVGGIVCATERFNPALSARASELRATGESLATTTIIQALWILRQTRRLESSLARLQAMSQHCHRQLERAGVFVYGETTSPILPIHAGRPTKASKLSYVLRKHDVAATPFSKPAVPMWQSRVRIGMSAAFSNEQVDQLVEALIRSCDEAGLLRPSKPPSACGSACPYRARFSMEDGAFGLDEERKTVLHYLHELVQAQRDELASQRPRLVVSDNRRVDPLLRSVIEAGHRARQDFGVGSGSSRWILGTYPPHLEVESRVCEMTGQAAVMLMTNTESGLMSTVAALCRPIKSCTAHWLLLPAKAQRAVLDGYRVASLRAQTTMIEYGGPADLLGHLGAIGEKKAASYITLILDAQNAASVVEKCIEQLSSIRSRFKGMTILLDSTSTLPDQSISGDSALLKVQRLAAKLRARLLVFTSFYHTLGLNGGCLAGDKALIEELRYTSRCYVFTAAPAPYMMGMVAEAFNMRKTHSLEEMSQTKC
ncbi:hypothetical protein LTR97_007161 [Elasticomyces elasticus]|uniref:serine C-palmitoyltransferase n=1 Tax=Elasticomyces elasticus TaxID=574655 RepID=A0AAN7WA62_9PEZI|nr:hypothetical protein LTR97_007161 [Elasticomyces elasticus]